MSLYTRKMSKYRKIIQKKYEIDDKIIGFQAFFSSIVTFIVNYTKHIS